VISRHIDIRIRYGETDQMGVVHHSQYALYLEEARMALLRDVGIHPEELEARGIILPVVAMQSRFSHPLRFGEVIRVECSISPPWNHKMEFRYRIFNETGRLSSRSRTTLVFADRTSGRLLEDPGQLTDMLDAARAGSEV
jgi:acyl-CoA thioester hydrolase